MATRPYPSFYIYLDSADEFRWRYQASNTKIIADSGEGYKTYADCKHGISLVQSSHSSPVWRSDDAGKRA